MVPTSLRFSIRLIKNIATLFLTSLITVIRLSFFFFASYFPICCSIQTNQKAYNAQLAQRHHCSNKNVVANSQGTETITVKPLACQKAYAPWWFTYVPSRMLTIQYNFYNTYTCTHTVQFVTAAANDIHWRWHRCGQPSCCNYNTSDTC